MNFYANIASGGAGDIYSEIARCYFMIKHKGRLNDLKVTGYWLWINLSQGIKHDFMKALLFVKVNMISPHWNKYMALPWNIVSSTWNTWYGIHYLDIIDFKIQVYL